MPRDIGSLKAGERAHADIVDLREQERVDEVPALHGELRIIDRLLRDLEPRRPRTQKTAAPPPIELRFHLLRACDQIRQIEPEQVVAFDYVRVALFDNTRQSLNGRMLRFLDVFWIDHDEFFPPGIVRERDAHEAIILALRK